MKQKFKIGDRVRLTHEVTCEGGLIGATGEITGRDPFDDTWLIVLDKKGPGGYSRVWANTKHIELVKPEKQPVIVITTDGKITTATKRLGKTVLGTATARCNVDDAFDFDFGAGLALARLTRATVTWGEAEKKPVPPKKVVCTEANESWFTVGRVYSTDTEAGRFFILDDDGEDWGLRQTEGGYEIRSLCRIAFFIPLVED